jgi:hypothetical protein
MKFSIRDLLWVMLVAGLALSWFVDRRRLVESHDKALGTVKSESDQRIAVLKEKANKLRAENENLGHMVGHMPESMNWPRDLEKPPASTPSK